MGVNGGGSRGLGFPGTRYRWSRAVLLIEGKRRIVGAKEEGNWKPAGQAVSLCPQAFRAWGAVAQTVGL